MKIFGYYVRFQQRKVSTFWMVMLALSISIIFLAGYYYTAHESVKENMLNLKLTGEVKNIGNEDMIYSKTVPIRRDFNAKAFLALLVLTCIAYIYGFSYKAIISKEPIKLSEEQKYL